MWVTELHCKFEGCNNNITVGSIRYGQLNLEIQLLVKMDRQPQVSPKSCYHV